jgi:hypothetical protein
MRLLRSILLLPVPLLLAACELGDITGVDPDSPSNLTYQLIPSGDPNAPLGVLLSWDPPASGRALTYDVYGRSASQSAWGRRATTTSPSFHDAGAPQAQYYVLAMDGQGNALGQSEVVTITAGSALPAPAGLVSVSLNAAIQLRWSSNAVDVNRARFDYYRVYSALYDVARTRCGAWSLEGTTVSDAFLASNLANGVTRCFAVSAVSRDGHESVWSAVREDTPRHDARNVLVYARAARADSAGFLFYDETARAFGVVTAASRAGLDFTVERHADGTLWLAPARSDVLMMTYGTAPVPDLTAIDRAPSSGLASVTIEAVPGYGYVFRTRKADGMHYAAVRVAYVAPTYVVFDWAYQSAVGNPELSRLPVP